MVGVRAGFSLGELAMRRLMRGLVPATGLISYLCAAGVALADPPTPDDAATICPTVQCMRVNNVGDNLDGTFDVEFETFNWFNTTPDGGVNRVLLFTGNLVSKLCGGGTIQVDVLGATAPAGWTVVQADAEKVEFQTTSTAFEIPDLDLCDSSVLGGCLNGGGPGVSTCGNEQGGFIITLRPSIPTGNLCSWTANWRHLDEFGVDNGDVMNFGAMSWTFGSISEDYSNTAYPPSSFAQNGVDDCAKAAQKKATKYGRTRLKETGKCIDRVNKGKVCDEAKRDQKIAKALAKMNDAIDGSCTDAQVENGGWCGTTVASLKTCLESEIDAGVDAAITAIYGPQ